MLALKTVIGQLRGRDSYELRDGVIHRRCYLFREELLPVDDIASWTIFPEMGVDVVELQRKNGPPLVWLDHHDDLTAILTALPTPD